MKEQLSEKDNIYGSHLPEMKQIQQQVEEQIQVIREDMKQEMGGDPVEHLLTRIKSEDSMREKCRRKHLPETPESALQEIHDAIGFRVVCAFLKDVYEIRNRIAGLPGYEVIEEKDYIKNAKPNGYRSYHMIVRVNGYYVEFQLRTISMDTWAALEHHLKYKKQVTGNEELIVNELKRCADELASTDVSMQTIRDMIFEQ